MSVYELNRDQLNQLKQSTVPHMEKLPTLKISLMKMSLRSTLEQPFLKTISFAAFQVNHIKSPALHMEGGEIFIQEGLPLNPPAENRKSRSHDPGSHPVQRCP